MSLNNKKGIPQHQTALISHMTNHKFDASLIYDEFKKITVYEKITVIPANVDLRIMKELRVLDLFQKEFDNDITNIQINSDTIVGNFHKQKQSNPDFFVTLKNTVIKGMGLGYTNSTICRQHDEKGGMAMIENTTRGHLGILYYDTNNNNIQFTSSAISSDRLLKFNKDRLNGIKNVLR